jgi:hypothetical protein
MKKGGSRQSLLRQLQQTFSKNPPPACQGEGASRKLAVFQTEAGVPQPAKWKQIL